MNELTKDMINALEAITNNETALERIRKEFYKSYEVNWLMEFSKTTPYSYDEWRNTCMYLIQMHKIIPTLHNLHQLSHICSVYNVKPLESISI